jgi:tetratricopeptide (TPR) repeat protein
VSRAVSIALVVIAGFWTQAPNRLVGVLHEYRAGDADRAVAQFAQWTPEEVDRAGTLSDGVRDSLSSAALALLHMEVHRTFALSPYREDARVLSGSMDELEPHFRAALRLSRQVCGSTAAVRSARLSEFCQLWSKSFEVVSQDTGLDALKWLVRGQHDEIWVGPEIVGGPVEFAPATDGIPLKETSHGRVSPRAEAAALRAYRQALTFDAGYPPAHLRIAWLHYLFDRREQAEQEFSVAYDASRKRADDANAYLSAMLLGRLQEDLGRRSAAAAAYEKALAALPSGQAAHLSLGLLTIETGQSVEGWRLIRETLTSSSSMGEEAEDPWYIFVPPKRHEPWGTVTRIAQMRELVRE